jgi:translocation and assembly module TamB
VIRRRIAILFVPMLLILLAAGAFAWLLHTEPGARWVLGRLEVMVPGQLRVDRVQGDLQSGLRIAGLGYQDTGLLLAVDKLELRLDMDYFPPALTVRELRLGELELRPADSMERQDKAMNDDWLSALKLPLPVDFTGVRVDRIAWYGDALEAPVEVHDLLFAARWFRGLELSGFEAAGDPWQLRGNLALDFQAPYALELDLRGSVQAPEMSGHGQPLDFQLSASGDLQRSHWATQIMDPGVTLSGDIRNLLGTPEWDLQLSANRVQWPLAGAAPAIQMDQFVASSYGTAADYGLEIESQVGGEEFPAVSARLLGSGDLTGLDIQVVDLQGEDANVQATARLDWLGGLRLQSRIDVVRLSLAPWLPQWGDAEPVRGALELAWQGQELSIENLNFEAPGSFAALSASSSVDLSAGKLVADFQWSGFAWPPAAAEPTVFSQQGQALLSGRLDDWSLQGEFDLSGPDFPAGRLQVNGTGNRQSLHFAVPQGAVLGGTLAGDIDVTWSPEISWATRARVSGLATTPLFPDFPGRLSGELAIRGRAEPFALDIDIRELTGVIRERQVGAEGRLELQENKVDAHDLQIRSGRSAVKLDGRLDAPDGLAFSARIDSLADFVDGASGSFEGEGLVSINPSRPFLQLDGAGRNLSWQETLVEEVVVATAREQGNALQLLAQGIAANDNRIETLSVVARGERPFDELELQADFDESRLRLQLRGAVRDWSALLESGWEGKLQVLRLDGDNAGFIELERPADLEFDTSGLVLAPFCLRGSREGRLCLEAAWRARGERAVEAVLDDMSPNLVLSLMGSELLFSQRLSGNLEWRQQPQAQPAARVRLQISPGQVTERGGDEIIMQTGAGLFGFQVADGRLYAGNLDIPVPGSGGIDTDFSVPDLSAGLDSSVQGRVRISLASIEPVLRLFPGVEGKSGPLTAEMDFSGSLADPQLTGHASLVRGTLSHFASGLLLEDIRLAGAVYQYDQTELSGTFRAGNGQGTIRAVLNFDDILNPELLLQITGEDLTVVNVPDLNVSANPDVRLVWREGMLNVSGRIGVPSARLSPRYLPTSAATESADVVIVAGEDPLAVEQESKPVEWRLQGNLELALGDDVLLQLERARAQLKGTTQFKWERRLVPVADGGFSLSGEIYAYGQLLKVTEGRVNFSNRPADNPFLNIRAEREIYGNTQITRAGVLVTGTLKQPILEPYSVPMTTRERALTLLITGSDINYEQGVGTVEVGMYVAPKLFISYGIGLFEDQSVISARYDLGRGFGIKTTSGQRETGADISYTVER